MDTLVKTELPRHVAIIMDGNGRWARERMLPRIVGHQKGVETVRMIVEEISALGIGYLTLYAFSAENWLRPKTEVRALMSLLKRYVSSETPRMVSSGIRFNIIGDREKLPPDVNRTLDKALESTAGCRGMVLTLALSYGSRQEILHAVRESALRISKGTMAPDELDEAAFSSCLYTADLPDPDLLIRTSGETRISNFLLWQLAYAELYFCQANWPDFSKDELYLALQDFCNRERRFGRTSDQLR
jgi:undecaprenyl diphosphate synthase